jgi:hypothetical protein
LGIVPDEQGRATLDYPQVVLESGLEVQLGVDGQLRSGEPAHLSKKGARGVDKVAGSELCTISKLNALYPASTQAEAGDLGPHELNAKAPRLIEEMHAKLLGAQPAGATDVQCGNRTVRQKRVVPLNQLTTKEQIGAARRVKVAFGVCGRI